MCYEIFYIWPRGQAEVLVYWLIRRVAPLTMEHTEYCTSELPQSFCASTVEDWTHKNLTEVKVLPSELWLKPIVWMPIIVTPANFIHCPELFTTLLHLFQQYVFIIAFLSPSYILFHMLCHMEFNCWIYTYGYLTEQFHFDLLDGLISGYFM